jgi:hypothetical protein
MRREFVPVDKIKVYTVNELLGISGCHFPDKEGNLVRVNKKRDGKTLEQHLEGIEYFYQLHKDGVKILPPLVLRTKDGYFKELDGFKRIMGAKKFGLPVMECFVAEEDERGKAYNYDGKKMTVKRGGQPFSRFNRPVEYGEDAYQESGHGKIIDLFKGNELKIEYRENIHVHWGPKGRNRLALGRADFDALAEAICGKDS